MATGARFKVPFRRKREGKTDYRRRLKLLLSGKPRLVVRKTSNHSIAQLVEYTPQGDKVLVSSHSNELRQYGWKAGTGNISAAYLTGFLCGLKAVKGGAKEAVLDIGLEAPVKKSKVFSVLKGILDAGVKVPHEKDVLPVEARIRGEHIGSYASLAQEAKEKRFSQYLKRALDPVNLPGHFDEVKANISGSVGVK